MRIIYKYQPAGWLQEFEVEIPRFGFIVKADQQYGIPTIWAQVDTQQPLIKRRFCICGTGVELPPNALYVDTWFEQALVWHLYELMEVAENETSN